jgi:hypothetical protein
MLFGRYIGIDYSGARAPDDRLPGLQVFEAGRSGLPRKCLPPGERARNWTRRQVAEYCRAALTRETPVVIGIDHGFSFPASYMTRHDLSDWDAFLADFVRYWQTAGEGVWVDSVRGGNARSGTTDELRLCERWTAGAKSVFQFDVQGSVAKSTHAGLPWLAWLRDQPAVAARLHCWPFDGLVVPPGRSVIAEVFPSVLRRRYPRESRTLDEHDAWCVARWLQQTDRQGSLTRYLEPPLTAAERRVAALEGWILGIC